ncbi:MAG: hypothetical protein HKN29_02900 [Rhodothermales bacterium]|nr:hypothetical protein [Rhodothermales bacterium]
MICTRPALFALVLGLATLLPAAPVQAQEHLFGSVDDPAELPRPAWWMRSNHVEGLAGLSLIGAQWRSGSRIRAHLESRRAVLDLDGSVRAGIYGRYDPDTDERYDILRALRYARFDGQSLYLRVGVSDRTRMGHGLVMDYYQGAAIWDERTVGAEAALTGRFLRVSGMTSDVRMNRLLAGRVEFSPRGRLRVPGGLVIGVGLTTDRRFPEEGPRVPTARELDIRLTAARSGGFRLEPFAAAAEYLRYGRGFMLGADLQTDNFIDLARLHARLAVQYAEDRFVPGYFGSFYEVNNPSAEVIASETLGEGPAIGIGSASAGTYLLSEFRLVFFESFEFRTAFRRYFGNQRLSTFHVRVFLRTSNLFFSFGEDRAGLNGFLGLFNDVGDLSVMSFRADYRLTGPLWLAVDARYAYQFILETDEVSRYAAQRRFEPFVGFRVDL